MAPLGLPPKMGYSLNRLQMLLGEGLQSSTLRLRCTLTTVSWITTHTQENSKEEGAPSVGEHSDVEL